MINGIILNEECILTLFISEDYFYINIFNFDLILKDNYILDNIEEYDEGCEGLFAKSFNLKDFYLIFDGKANTKCNACKRSQIVQIPPTSMRSRWKGIKWPKFPTPSLP